MYVPTGGRDVVPGGKVGTRDKTAEDLQALDTGEADEAKLRARQKQLDIGKNTQGYKKLMLQKLRGRQLQVPYRPFFYLCVSHVPCWLFSCACSGATAGLEAKCCQSKCMY